MKEVPVKFGNYKLRYAWVSQRGFYPDEPDKANQDAHVEVENFCAEQGVEDMHLFGVFDGHGKTGTECAQWARDQVPLELASCLEENPDDMERSFKEAFLKVNKSLHKNRQIDDKMSGTTAIVVLVNKGTLHVANVGDSRAIVAQMLDSKLTAYSLSQDQTPFRKDERERCKRAANPNPNRKNPNRNPNPNPNPKQVQACGCGHRDHGPARGGGGHARGLGRYRGHGRRGGRRRPAPGVAPQPDDPGLRLHAVHRRQRGRVGGHLRRARAAQEA